MCAVNGCSPSDLVVSQGQSFGSLTFIYIHDFHHSGEGREIMVIKASPLWQELSNERGETGELEIPDPVSILVVEDDPSFFSIIDILQEAGYLVDHAITAEAALERLETYRMPMIPLVDIGLPDHSGIELLKNIEKLPLFTQSVAMSSSPEREDEALDAGAIKFLDKKMASNPDAFLRHLRPVRRTIRKYIRSLMDRLTGFPNDTYFDQVLRRALSQARHRQEPIALLFIDADGLKALNTRHGVQNGSRLITHIGEYVRKYLRPWDIAGRYRTGDEFMIIMPRTKEDHALMTSISIDLDVRSHCLRLDTGEEIEVSASVGYVVRQPDEIESDAKAAADRIIKDADEEMRKAKEKRKAEGVAVRR